jgi:hypothetical protein
MLLMDSYSLAPELQLKLGSLVASVDGYGQSQEASVRESSMLLPDKHIKLSESILGLSAFVLSQLGKPRTLDELIASLAEANKNRQFPTAHGIDHLLLAASFLFSLGIVQSTADGTISRCD